MPAQRVPVSNGVAEGLVSVLVPFRDEAAALPAFLAELLALRESLAPRPVEVVAVDDGSRDRGAELIATSGLVDRLIRHDQGRGQGAALRTAFKASRGELLLWWDADATHPHGDALRVLALAALCDQAVGVRRGPAVDGLMRRLVKGGLALATTAFWGRRIPDLNSGLRAFRRACLADLDPHLPDRFSCSTTATLRALGRGWSLGWCQVGYRQRPVGSRSKFRPVSDTSRLLAVIVRHAAKRPRAKRLVATISCPGCRSSSRRRDLRVGSSRSSRSVHELAVPSCDA